MSTGFTAAVLAGGAATRVRSILGDCPKALAPVNGKPFLFFLLDQLVISGAERIVLCTGHLGDKIRAAIGDRYKDCPVLYSQETSPLGTGGALRAAMRCCDANLWLVSNGDSYVAVSLGEFVSWYRQTEQNGALVLTWVDNADRFGTVEVAQTGLIARFQEKNGLAAPGCINAGIYLLPRTRIEELPEHSFLSLERDVFPKWAAEGLRAYCVTAPFTDIGLPESLRAAARFFVTVGGGSE